MGGTKGGAKMYYEERYYFDPTRSFVLKVGPDSFFVLPDDVHTSKPVSMADSSKYFFFIDRYYKKGTQVLGGTGPAPSPFK